MDGMVQGEPYKGIEHTYQQRMDRAYPPVGGAARQVLQNRRSQSPLTEARQERPSRNSEHSKTTTPLMQETSHLHGTPEHRESSPKG